MESNEAACFHERRYEVDGLHYATLMINYNDASILGGTWIDSSPLHPGKGSFFSPVYDIPSIVLFPFFFV